MKTLLPTLFLCLCVALAACKKDKQDAATSLQGKWQLIQSYSSSGGPGQWADVGSNKTYSYVEFNADGSLSGNTYTDYKTYIIKDSVTLVFYKADKTIENFGYIIKNGILEMGPTGPVVCYEGCGSRFTKLRN